jgi:hypothetical protein
MFDPSVSLGRGGSISGATRGVIMVVTFIGLYLIYLKVVQFLVQLGPPGSS